MNGTFTCVYFLMQEDKTGVLYVTEKGINLKIVHIMDKY